MSSTEKNQILRRKVSQGNRLRDVATVSPSRALRLALARAADDLWDLGLVVQGIQQDMLDLDTVQAGLETGRLILVLRTAEGDCALALLTRTALAALIEVQTMGAVFDQPPEDRAFTGTVAERAWLYLSQVLDLVGTLAGGTTLAHQVRGYRLASRADGPRAAGLFLSAPQYRVLTATVDFGPGLRQGDVQLVLPVRAVPADPPRHRATGAPSGADQGFASLPTALQVVLGPVPVSLAWACSLKPGDMMPLPPDILDHAQLRAGGGKPVARGRLGRMGGHRALRLNLPGKAPGAGGSDPADGTAFAEPGPQDPVGLTLADPAAAEAQPSETELDWGADADMTATPDDDATPATTDDATGGDFPAMTALADLGDLSDWEEEGIGG